MKIRTIYKAIALVLLISCNKWNEEKKSKVLEISVINNCYATMKFYKNNGEYYTKETFDCEYEKEIYRQFETGIYKVIAEGENKKSEKIFEKTEYQQQLIIEF